MARLIWMSVLGLCCENLFFTIRETPQHRSVLHNDKRPCLFMHRRHMSDVLWAFVLHVLSKLKWVAISLQSPYPSEASNANARARNRASQGKLEMSARLKTSACNYKLYVCVSEDFSHG